MPAGTRELEFSSAACRQPAPKNRSIASAAAAPPIALRSGVIFSRNLGGHRIQFHLAGGKRDESGHDDRAKTKSRFHKFRDPGVKENVVSRFRLHRKPLAYTRGSENVYYYRDRECAFNSCAKGAVFRDRSKFHAPLKPSAGAGGSEVSFRDSPTRR